MASWKFSVKGQHNHDTSKEQSARPTHRRVLQPMKDTIDSLIAEALRQIEGRNAVEGPDLLIMERLEGLLHSPTGTLVLWRRMSHAVDEDDFCQAWQDLQIVFDDQTDIIVYLGAQWLPLMYQWAGCYVSSYKNLGQRTISLTESSYQAIKVYLISGTSTLLDLFCVMKELVDGQEKRYILTLASQRSRARRGFHGRAIFMDRLRELPYLKCNPKSSSA